VASRLCNELVAKPHSELAQAIAAPALRESEKRRHSAGEARNDVALLNRRVGIEKAKRHCASRSGNVGLIQQPADGF
jgi:CelD/BcsL family acetyltransferase involved in cellulose biosynthesis